MKTRRLSKSIIFYLISLLVLFLAGYNIAGAFRLHHSSENTSLSELSAAFFLLVVLGFSGYFFSKFYADDKREMFNYKKLFVGSPYAIYVMEKSTLRMLAVNSAMCSLYGYTEDEFLKMTALDIRPESERNRLTAFLDNFEGDFDDSGRWIHKKKNGECFYVQITFHSISFFDKEAYLTTVTNIDKSIHDEKKIFDLLHLYETVNKATNDVIWDYDLELDNMRWMQGYRETYGYQVEDSGNDFWGMYKVHPQDRQRLITYFRKIIAEKQKSWFADYRYICADHTVKYISDRGFLIFDDANIPVRIIGAMKDVTRQKAYEQQLLNQNEQLKQIAWINSHQVRRPLSNILGLVDLIKDPENKKSEILELIELLVTSTTELNDAVVKINRQTLETKSKG